MFSRLNCNSVVQVEIIAKEHLKSLTDPEEEEEEGITAEAPVKENGVSISIRFNNNTEMSCFRV